MRPELFDPATFADAQEAVEFIGNVLESSTAYAMIATDEAGIVVMWNEGARRLYGYRPAEMLGKSWRMLHAEEDRRRGLPDEVMGRALADGKWEGEAVRVRKDGSSFMAKVVATPRRRSDGAHEGFLLVSCDVTEQVRLGRELERAQEYNRSLIESAPDAMVIVNADGGIRMANAETERLFGYDRQQLIGQPVEVLIPERYHERHPDHRANFFSEPRTRPMGAGLDLSGRRKDGVEFPVEISLSPLETDEGLLVTAAIRDVTERKHFEQELRDANDQLEAASRAKDRFLASMSHELRTPLNAILGFTGTLLMELPGPLNEEQGNQLRTVQVNSKHLLSLINDLLDLARIESGKFEIHREQFDCASLLDEVVVGLKPLAHEKRLGLEVITPGSPVELCTDRRALTQILINLANNAIKFTDRGEVRLQLTESTEPEARIVRFSVIDTGRGIKSSDQARLFAAFEQIGGAVGRPFEGTGLGLYICQTLATAMGATITFESEFGRGSHFTLELRE